MGQISSILAGARGGVHRGREILGRPIDINPSRNDRFGTERVNGDMMGIQNDSVLNGQTLGVYDQTFLNSEDSLYSSSWERGNDSGRFDILGHDANGNFNLGIGEDGLSANLGYDLSGYLFQGEGSYEYDGFAINRDLMLGADSNIGLDLTADPGMGTGELAVNAGIFAGVEANLGAEYDFGLGQIEVGVNPRIGPYLDAEGSINYNNGRITTDTDLDYGLFELNPYANVSLDSDHIREWGTDVYNDIDDFVDGRFPNDYYDPYTEQLGFENGDYLMDNIPANGIGLEDQILFDDLGIEPYSSLELFTPEADLYNSFDLGIDTFDVNSLDLDTSGAYDPIGDSWETYDLGLDTQFDSSSSGNFGTSGLGTDFSTSGFDSGSFGGGSFGTSGFGGGSFGGSGFGGSSFGGSSSSFFSTGGFDGGAFGSSWGGFGGGGYEPY